MTVSSLIDRNMRDIEELDYIVEELDLLLSGKVTMADTRPREKRMALAAAAGALGVVALLAYVAR